MNASGTITAVLRTALAESPLPLAGIARKTNVERSSISRFLAERSSLRLDSADRIAELFGFQLTLKGPPHDD
ncbi:MAG: helix-turn-helix domain-containing protein [Planctomycetaceae bacterium]